MALMDGCLTAGQSNEVGRTTAVELSPDTNPAMVLEWVLGDFVPLDDPGATTPAGYRPTQGSSHPAIGNALTARTGRPLFFVRGAWSGSSLLASNSSSNGTWDDDPAGFTDRFTNAVARAQQALEDLADAGHTLGRFFVVWCQGEQDATQGNDLDQYQAALEALPGRFRTALGLPNLQVFVVRTGTRTAEGPGWKQVRDAQVAACAASDGLTMAYTGAVDFVTRGLMDDDPVHWGQEAQNEVGTAVGTAVADFWASDIPPAPPTVGTHRRNAARLLLGEQ